MSVNFPRVSVRGFAFPGPVDIPGGFPGPGSGSGFGPGSGLRAPGSGVRGPGFVVRGSGFGVRGSGFPVSGVSSGRGKLTRRALIGRVGGPLARGSARVVLTIPDRATRRK